MVAIQQFYLKKQNKMENKTHIKTSCTIKNSTIFIDETIVFQEDKNMQFLEFAKKAYKSLEESYPKFFKMDNLCKLAYLGAEFLEKSVGKFEKDTALVFSNRASSLDTDRKYQNSIADKDNYYPSPAVFVYTLPNITIGEISIRHKLQSENAFFVSENYNKQQLLDYASILIANNKTNSVLCSWINFDQGEYELQMFLLEK